MGQWFPRVEDVRSGYRILAEKPYGMIEASQGKLSFIRIRPFPKLVSMAEAMWIGGWSHRRIRRDRVQVFYNQPARHRNFLVAKYAVSELGTTLATMRASFRTFMEIARLKQVDAALCQVLNPRVTDRIMKYWGFEPHHPRGRGRHFIRRFYGKYPDYTDWIDQLVLPASAASADPVTVDRV
jgi:hypothetical protein